MRDQIGDLATVLQQLFHSQSSRLGIVVIGVGRASFVDETGLAEKKQWCPCGNVGGVRQIQRDAATLAQEVDVHHHAAYIDGNLVGQECIQNRGSVPDAGIESPAGARRARLAERGRMQIAQRDDDWKLRLLFDEGDASLEQRRHDLCRHRRRE